MALLLVNLSGVGTGDDPNYSSETILGLKVDKFAELLGLIGIGAAGLYVIVNNVLNKLRINSNVLVENLMSFLEKIVSALIMTPVASMSIALGVGANYSLLRPPC